MALSITPYIRTSPPIGRDHWGERPSALRCEFQSRGDQTMAATIEGEDGADIRVTVAFRYDAGDAELIEARRADGAPITPALQAAIAEWWGADGRDRACERMEGRS